MDAKKSDLRVLMFPWLAHGHVFPFLELAKGLTKKHFHIYFCSTPINLDSIKNSFNNNNNDDNNDDDNNNNDHVSIELVELHLPTPPELPPHYHTTKNIPPHLMPTLMKAFQASAPAFSAIIARLKPDLLVYDGFQPWAARAAEAQGIPPVLFATTGSTSLAFFHHHHTHKSWDTFPFEGIRLKEHEKRAMIAAGKSIKVSNVDGDDGFAFGMFKLSCEIVLIKTYRGIESKYMDYLSRLCERKLVPTGPLISHGDDDQDDQDLEIMKWLNEREEGSTLYISFGSENYLTKEQMVEIAKGLELSGVNFIWVSRSPAGDGGGGAVRKGRGVVVPGWAPQAAILAHRSVGGFMTHCGWSSVSESVFFGVPVVAVPFKADQPVNARVAVEAGIGVEVARGGDGGFDGDGVARAINEVFVEGRGGFKRRVEELREKMKVEEEGAMDEVVEELSRVCMKKSAAAWHD